MKDEKLLDKKMILQIGMGVLLYMLLRRSNHKEKMENKPVDVKGHDNEVTKGVKLEVRDNSLIRIDPKFYVQKNFRNSEYFGSRREVPLRHYEAWENLSKLLQVVRNGFGFPVIITQGYNVFKDGSTAVVKPQNNNFAKFWEGIHAITLTNPHIRSFFERLSNGSAKIGIKKIDL